MNCETPFQIPSSGQSTSIYSLSWIWGSFRFLCLWRFMVRYPSAPRWCQIAIYRVKSHGVLKRTKMASSGNSRDVSRSVTANPFWCPVGCHQVIVIFFIEIAKKENRVQLVRNMSGTWTPSRVTQPLFIVRYISALWALYDHYHVRPWHWNGHFVLVLATSPGIDSRYISRNNWWWVFSPLRCTPYILGHWFNKISQIQQCVWIKKK